MRTRTLLAATAAGALLAGLTGLPSFADPGPVPDNRTGHVEAWGNSTSAADAIAVPAALDGEQVVDLATSTDATAAVTADGALHIWGKSTAGEVLLAPTDVTGASAVSLFSNNGAVLNSDGSVVAWGAQTGVSTVPAGLSAKAVSVGTMNAYAVTTGGTLASWGAEHDEYNPGPPAGLTGLVDVSAAGALMLALDADGEVTSWGALAAYVPTPAEIQGHVAQITTGGAATAGAILDDGSIKLWGFSVPETPEAIAEELEGKRVVSLDVDANVIAATEDGEVYVWGSSTDITDVPASLDGEHVAAVSVSQFHAAVIATDFKVMGPPAIAGSPTVGQTLTATPAELSLEPDDPATGQWLADGDELAGETGATLVLASGLLGKSISYRSTATRGTDTVESTSAEVGPVIPKAASTTTLTVTPATGGYGDPRTATATVTKTGGTPTGTVTFTLGGTETTAPLSGGQATWALPKNLAVGTQQLTAAYGGDGFTEPSTSASAAVTVGKAASTLKASKPRLKGETETLVKKAIFTLTVQTTPGASPAGTVFLTLKGGAGTGKATKIAAQVSTRGVVKVVVRKLKRGTYTATWKYAGSTTVAASVLRVKHIKV